MNLWFLTTQKTQIYMNKFIRFALNLSCIDMPQYLHSSQRPSARNAAIVNYSLDTLGFDYDGIVVLLDSDMFLVKEFSVKEYMEGYLIRGHPQSRSDKNTVIDYFWVGIVFFDMSNLPNKRAIDFSDGLVNGVHTDTGGCTHYYLSQNRDVELGEVNRVYTLDAYSILKDCSCSDCLSRDKSPCKESLEKLDSLGKFDVKQIQFIKESLGDNSEFYLDSHFFHYRCGSNWSKQERNYRYKIKAFNNYFRDFCPPKRKREESYVRKK